MVDRRKKKVVGSEPKENATYAQRAEIIDWHYANGRKQVLTAQHFNDIYPTLQLKQPLISSWLKSESMWQAKLESEAPSAKRTRATRHPEVTEMLDAWIMMACEDGLLLTGDIIHQKWRSFADMHGVPQDERLNLSEGWLSKYKSRMGLKGVKRHGEAASASTEAIEKEKHRIQNIIKQSGLAEWDVFNMDETGLFYA